ncbi:glucosamine-6-phosphate deaminase [Spiroplasma sabaudiense Ar-1343]|uniref:Glucosamine-6-phosphate deaminase n=1 Tax=Spiroplasma sabaudiense Ar-1343 TaxID=1276257 RepID=W6AAX6_9MOLU|nr:glucosamine-6-phosphate deaminase [Spiroplasma sabaudiense]AHI54161.1 glucosamine-6-phosphate deaminase [Spiroplasma sabaudiense Ar-1343]
MKVIKVLNEKEVGKVAGDLILSAIQSNSSSILGLATGSTPESTYEYLIEDFKKNKTDWSKVKTFNLDEYVGLSPDHKKSYRYFMNDKLFHKINIDIKNTHVPDGLKIENPEDYDKLISKNGGIDLQLLGIGTNGHIGFNEPGTSFDSLTSVVDLTAETIEVNSRFFESALEVPKKAVSMGLTSIMNARKIVLIAIGKNKAEAIKQLINGNISINWPCTILQNHKDVTVIIDEEAASLI